MAIYKAMVIPSYYRRNWNAKGRAWIPPRLTSNTSNIREIWFVDPKLSGGTMTDAGVMTWGTAAIQRFNQVWTAFRGEQAQNKAWIINNGSKTFTVLDISFADAKNITRVEMYCPVVGGHHSAVTGVAIYDMSSGSPVQLKYDLTDTNASGTRSYAISRDNVSKLRICIRPDTNGNDYPSLVQRLVIYASNGGKAPYAVTSDTKLPNYIGADYATYQYKVRKVTLGSTTQYQFKKN